MTNKVRYEVIRGWDSAETGSIVELTEPVHPALKANVRKLGKGGQVEVATPAEPAPPAEPVEPPAPPAPPKPPGKGK